MRHSIYLKKYIYSILTIILLFVIWQVIASIKDVELIYPSLGTIFKRISETLSTWDSVSAILLTFVKVLISVLICLIISFIITFLYYLIPSSTYIIRPIVTIMKVAPFAAIAVYLFLAISSTAAPYILTSFVVLPIMIESFISGVDNLNKEIDDDLKTLDISKFRKFFVGIVPILFPTIIMSLLSSFGLGFKTMIMGEYICSTNHSIGGYIYDYKSSTSYDYILAWVVILVFLIGLIDLLIRFMGNKIKNK